MSLFSRHKITTLIMGFYLVLWLLVIYWFMSDLAYDEISPEESKEANGAVLFFTLALAITGFLGLCLKVYFAKGQPRKDYFKFLLLYSLYPVFLLVAALIYLVVSL